MTETRYKIPNLDRGLHIMELLSRYPRGLLHSEIVAHTGYPDNSVYRITMTLQARGYVLRDEMTRHWRLSRKLLVVGYAAMSEVNLVEMSLDVLRQLRDKTRETVVLCTMAGDDVITLDQVLGHHPFNFTVQVGSRVHLNTSAPGKALLAFLPSYELNGILDRIDYERFTERTLADRAALRSELDRVRIRGFSIDHAEELEGVHSIGAAILDQSNYPVASIAVTGPANRIPDTDFERIGGLVHEHAHRISQRLGNDLLNF